MEKRRKRGKSKKRMEVKKKKMMTKMKGKGRWQKAIIGIAMAAIMLAFLPVMVPTGSADTGDTHNVIIPGATNLVLMGQMLKFQGFDLGCPIVGRSPEEIEGLVFGIATGDYDTQSYFTVPGMYFADSNANGVYDVGETSLAVCEPVMDFDLKVMGKSVSSITVGTLLEIDFTTNLRTTDTVDLRIIDPIGYLLKINPANSSQKFDNINVSYLLSNYGHPNGIDTTGWKIGTYTFCIKTEKDMACGLDISSNTKTLTILKVEISIEAEKTSVVELEKVKLIVKGVPGHLIQIATSDPSHTVFPGGIEDNPPGDTTGFNDTIDADGVRKYVVYFTDTGTYTIKATDLTAGLYDTIDISVLEKQVTFDVPSTCVIGTDLVVRGAANTGDTIDIAIEDIIVADDIFIEIDGTFEVKLPTPQTYGTGMPGSIKIEGFIDAPFTLGQDVSAFDDDGTTVILMVAPSLTAELSSSEIAQGDKFTVSGTAPGSKCVDIMTISPKGGGGHGISPTSVAGVPGITRDVASVLTTDHTFSKVLHVDEDADTGIYLVTVLTPGRDGVYGATGKTDILDAIATQFPGVNLATKTQEQIISMLQDLITAAGSDDLVWIGKIKIDLPYVSLDSIADVQVGDPLEVTGSTNREEGTPIAITVKGPIELPPQIAKAENGKFNATFDTKGIPTGTYTVTADDGDGHLDTTTVNIIRGKISVSITTDKVEYTPREIMQTEIRLRNPTDNTKNALFTWYFGIPEYDLWVEMTAIRVNLPAGYDQTFTVPIPVGDWGTESFCGCHAVSLTDTKTKKVVSVDSTAWIYMPGAVSTSKPLEEIAKEITKEFEGVGLLS